MGLMVTVCGARQANMSCTNGILRTVVMEQGLLPPCTVSALLEGDDHRRFTASKRPCLVSREGARGNRHFPFSKFFLEGCILRFSCVFADWTRYCCIMQNT